MDIELLMEFLFPLIKEQCFGRLLQMEVKKAEDIEVLSMTLLILLIQAQIPREDSH